VNFILCSLNRLKKENNSIKKGGYCGKKRFIRKKSFIMVVLCMFFLSFFSLFSMAGANILGYREADGPLVLFDVDKKKVIEKIPWDKSLGSPVKFLKNGTQLFVSLTWAHFGIFDLKEKKIVAEYTLLKPPVPFPTDLQGYYALPELVPFADGERFAIIEELPDKEEAIVTIKKLGTNEVIRTFSFMVDGRYDKIYFSPDDAYVVVANRKQSQKLLYPSITFHIWSVATGKKVEEFCVDLNQKNWDFSVSDNATHIVSSYSYDKLNVSKNARFFRRINTRHAIEKFTISLDGTCVVTYIRSPKKQLKIFDVKTAKEVHEMPIKERYLYFMQFKPPAMKQDSDEPERREYWQMELQEKESDVIPQKMKVKVKMYGQEFYIPRLLL